MSQHPKPNFSQIVCAAPPVQTAFALHRPTRVWWKVILRLHGKPTDLSATHIQQRERVAEGFKFYAWLYRFLAFVFLLISVALFCVPLEAESLYWPLSSFFLAFYLWTVSGLGYAGAKIYRLNPPQGIVYLLAFMVMIVTFLCLFLAGMSVAAHCLDLLTTPLNLIASSTLFTFGIGSYGIEIVYLATCREVDYEA